MSPDNSKHAANKRTVCDHCRRRRKSFLCYLLFYQNDTLCRPDSHDMLEMVDHGSKA